MLLKKNDLFTPFSTACKMISGLILVELNLKYVKFEACSNHFAKLILPVVPNTFFDKSKMEIDFAVGFESNDSAKMEIPTFVNAQFASSKLFKLSILVEEK